MKKVFLTNRDEAILNALWKWKMLTTRGIWKAYFPSRSSVTVHNRLILLEKAGYISSCPIDPSKNDRVWILGDKGFHLVKRHLPELVEKGYRSEYLEHDFLVTAIHAGDWLAQRPKAVALFSEQELRRLDPDHYPPWVPHSELHRPDGYWRIPFLEKSATIALEVELTQKSSHRYQMTAAFYEQHPNIFRVVWVVPSVELAQHIRDQVMAICPETTEIHLFLRLKDVRELGWEAKIIHGREKSLTLRTLLTDGVKQNMNTCLTLDLLDSRKSAGRTNRSTIPQNP